MDSSKESGTRRQRDEEKDNNTTTTNNTTGAKPRIVDDAHAMFDLAGGSVEDPLLATLNPGPAATKKNSTLKTLIDGNNISLTPIELRCDLDKSKSFEIGRGPDLIPPFRIDYGRLSAKHLKFTYDGSSKTLLMTDTSTNGIWLNGERMKKGEPVVVNDGDSISFLKPLDDALHLPFVVTLGGALLFNIAKKNSAAAAAAANNNSNNEDSSSNNDAQQQPKPGDGPKLSLDAFQQEITCSICLGTYIKPTCVLPCLHTFCQPCIRKYIAEQLRHGVKSDQVKCIECRAIMGNTQLNHKVQALINEVTRVNTDFERPEEEIKAIEKEAEDSEEKAKNQGVKSFELTGSKTQRKTSDAHNGGHWGGDSDDFEEEEEYEDSDEDGRPQRFGGYNVNRHNQGGGGWGFGNNHVNLPGAFLFQNHYQPTACKSCTQPDPRDGFQCPANQQHLVCKYCRTSFPDRPTCGIAQRCKFCATAFCDVYSGPCKNAAGVGVMKEVQQHKFEKLPTSSLFKGNQLEIQHFQYYLSSKNIQVEDVWKECLEKFKNDEWSLDLSGGNSNNNNNITVETSVCHPCCMRIFAALLVKYRIAIPRNDWPPAVGSRPDCWYGLDCRTQHGNPMHAQKYNHVCLPRKGKE